MRSEFIDEALIIEKFGKIPKETLKGIRMPFLQMAGNNQYKAMQKYGLEYDVSWPSQNYVNPAGLWPYTLDYKSTQDCVIGPCPDESIPGPWVFPMLMWTDDDGYQCSMTDACSASECPIELYNMILRNFHANYNSNRAPFGFYVHSSWFANENRTIAYVKFLDYLGTLPDVFAVSLIHFHYYSNLLEAH